MLVTKGFLTTRLNKDAKDCRWSQLHHDFPRFAVGSPAIWKAVSLCVLLKSVGMTTKFWLLAETLFLGVLGGAAAFSWKVSLSN